MVCDGVIWVVGGSLWILGGILWITNRILPIANRTLLITSKTLPITNKTLPITTIPQTPPAENHSLRSVVEEAHKETEETQQREGGNTENLLYPTSDETDQVADRERPDEEEQQNGMGLHAPPRLRALDVQENRPRQEDSQSHPLKGSRYDDYRIQRVHTTEEARRKQKRRTPAKYTQ